MAALYFTSSASDSTIFKAGFAVNNSVSIPYLKDLVGANGQLVINEVTMQHRDTIQYFLTFDDFISYYYFGKGLGAMTINGMIFSDCVGQFNGLNNLISRLASIRGTTQSISFGNTAFSCLMNSFTVRSSADMSSIHSIDFNIQMDILNSSMPPTTFTPSC